MPELRDHPSRTTTKVLIMGDPGSGKTGALASLAHVGYNLRIIDLDNGLDVLKNLLTDPKSPYDPKAADRVKYITITDKPTSISATSGMNSVRSGTTVWNKMSNMLSNWRVPGEDLGSITTWTPKEVLVIDSLTLAGIAAHNFAVLMNQGNKNQDPRMMYFHAQNYIENLMQILYSEEIKCNIVINSHITFIGDDLSVMHGYPTTIGRALSSKIGRYFNSVLLMKSDGKNHRLHTVPTSSKVELKSSAPLRVKDHYEIKFGLSEYFRDVQG